MDTIAKISDLLEKNNRMQKELTDYLGLDKSTFSAWKTGKSKSYSKYLAQIAQFFGVSIDYLLDNEKSPTEESEEPEDEELIILNRNAKKLSPEQQKLLNDVVRQMLKEDFDD